MRGVSYLSILLFLLLLSCRSEQHNEVPVVAHNIAVKAPLTKAQKDLALQIENHFKKICGSGSFSGAVLVAEGEKIIFKDACGFADYRTKKELSVYSTFQLASVSKMFTAAAIMLLHRDGWLHYDSLVKTYIPDFPYPDVTVRHLLHHRSGLPHYMFFSDDKWPRDIPMNNLQMHCLLEEHKPSAGARAGKKFRYENSNYAYLALLVEYLSGKPFERFLRDRIFEPLGMHDTKIYNASKETDIPGMTKGHHGRRPIDETANHINGVVGDKGVYSTVDDLMKYNLALFGETLFTKEELEEAFSPGSPELMGKDNYGFGWRISSFEPDKMVFHYGWWNGYKTCFMRFLNSKRCIIVLTNRDKRLTLPREIMQYWWREAMPSEDNSLSP
jgi:CubicO group peptidase (beta-lactamase class C family)